MNKFQYNFPGTNEKEFCECGIEITNLHLYECAMLNRNKKTVPYMSIFESRLCEIIAILNILRENQEKHEKFTQAQDSILGATSLMFVFLVRDNIYIYMRELGKFSSQKRPGFFLLS